MSVPEYLMRAEGRVDLDRLAEATVVVFGIGTVGSAMVDELASCGVRRFRLIDGDSVEISNLARGALKREYVGRNKAEAMAELLRHNYPPEHLDIQYFPAYVDGEMSDNFLAGLLKDADLVIAATDQRDAQHRIGGRSVVLDIPAVFPALHEASGEGEVFICRGVQDPCLNCWESFRGGNQDLRAVAALSIEAVPVIVVAVELALGLLDPDSVFARRWFSLDSPRDRHRTLFLVQPGSPVQSALVHWQQNCSMCPVPPPPETLAPATVGDLIDPARAAARERPFASLLAAWAFICFILALATGSGVAFFICTAMTVATLSAFRRPDRTTLRRIQATGGFGAAIGAVLFGLFIAGVSTGNPVITLLVIGTLVATGLVVTRRPADERPWEM